MKPCTYHIVQLAMQITCKDVRTPKCVRDGIVKLIKSNLKQKQDEKNIHKTIYNR